MGRRRQHGQARPDYAAGASVHEQAEPAGNIAGGLSSSAAHSAPHMLPTGGSVHRPQAAHLTAATKGVHVAASGGNASQVAISRAGNHGNQAPYSSGICAGTDEPQDARLHTAELATRSLAMGPRSGVAQAAWMQDARGSMSAAVQQVAQLKAELACVAGENASLSAELTGLRDARMAYLQAQLTSAQQEWHARHAAVRVQTDAVLCIAMAASGGRSVPWVSPPQSPEHIPAIASPEQNPNLALQALALISAPGAYEAAGDAEAVGVATTGAATACAAGLGSGQDKGKGMPGAGLYEQGGGEYTMVAAEAATAPKEGAGRKRAKPSTVAEYSAHKVQGPVVDTAKAGSSGMGMLAGTSAAASAAAGHVDVPIAQGLGMVNALEGVLSHRGWPKKLHIVKAAAAVCDQQQEHSLPSGKPGKRAKLNAPAPEPPTGQQALKQLPKAAAAPAGAKSMHAGVSVGAADRMGSMAAAAVVDAGPAIKQEAAGSGAGGQLRASAAAAAGADAGMGHMRGSDVSRLLRLLGFRPHRDTWTAHDVLARVRLVAIGKHKPISAAPKHTAKHV